MGGTGFWVGNFFGSGDLLVYFLKILMESKWKCVLRCVIVKKVLYIFENLLYICLGVIILKMLIVYSLDFCFYILFVWFL